jgi:class 3 adenylate cyclase
MKRRMAAILAADVVGFSRLIAEDEEGTLRQLAECRYVLDGFVVRHGGRIFNTAGDSIMCAFETALDAARAAIEIQDFARAQIGAQPSGKWLQFRIGISVGEVVERKDDLLGMAVNLAARLETLASPGGICISRAVYEAVSAQVSAAFVDIGERHVKNIPFPVHAFTIAGPRCPTGGNPLRKPRLSFAMRALSLAGICLAILLGVGSFVSDRQLSRPSQPERSVDASALPPADKTAQALQLTANPVEAFSRLAQKGGQIDDPGSAPGLYHNALLFEAKGEAIAAHRAYYTLARMGLDFIDPHLRYAALVRAHEGRFIAQQVYAELNEDAPTRATALVYALQFDGAERRARLNALLAEHPDFAPAHFLLAEEHTANRIGGLQTDEDGQVEHAALSAFLTAHREGRLARFFLDQSVLTDWLDRAHRRHEQIELSAEGEIAMPATAVAP